MNLNFDDVGTIYEHGHLLGMKKKQSKIIAGSNLSSVNNQMFCYIPLAGYLEAIKIVENQSKRHFITNSNKSGNELRRTFLSFTFDELNLPQPLEPNSLLKSASTNQRRLRM